MKTKITTLLMVFTISLYGYGEDIKKLKYGKVSTEELTMSKYEKDTSANAVVLYSYGEFDPNNFKFSQHIRIKVLKQTGSSQANMAFQGKVKSTLKGCTYNLENGEIVKSPLKKESIFEERVFDDRYVTRIALPDVRVGSIIEVLVTQDGVPNAFDFQKSIPVIYAALHFPQNDYVNIKMQTCGILGFAYLDSSTWITKDLPAFKYEPFMKSENDYKVMMEFELASIITPNFFKVFCDSWSAVTLWYMENQNFGVLLDGLNFCLGEMVDSVKASSKTDEEKLTNAMNIVKRRIKWNKRDACFGSQPFTKTLELKSGNTADINLILVALLRKSGISCDPIIFSTRENGKISKYFPTINKFNYVIAGARVAGKTYYLDASQEYLPFGVVPNKLLGCVGHIVNRNAPIGTCSVTLEPIQKDKFTVMHTLKLDSTGLLNGKIIIDREDYNAIEFKENLKSYTDHDAYIEKLESDNSGIRINSYNFSNINNLENPLREELNISIGSNSNNEILVINPLVFPEIKSNPFAQEKRITPVSFPQIIDYSTIINIMIPANYQVAEAPKSTIITNPDNSLKFSYKIDYNEAQVSIRIKFTVAKLNYDLSEYSTLRQVFEMMVQKQSESIIFKKI